MSFSTVLVVIITKGEKEDNENSDKDCAMHCLIVTVKEKRKTWEVI